MHMTGMENFNAASKRGGPGAIPINSTVSPGLVGSSGDMSQATTMTGTNKSNMQAILNNKNKGTQGQQSSKSPESSLQI